MSTHPDDEFHPPTDDNPYWTETCWFTFTVPERKMSGQLYPFFRANQRVAAGGAYFWDDQGSEMWNCLYAKKSANTSPAITAAAPGIRRSSMR